MRIESRKTGTAALAAVLLQAITTLAPSLANRRAVAAPMPEAAPLMIATLPSRRMARSPRTQLPGMVRQSPVSGNAFV